jgi:hypothetical protein
MNNSEITESTILFLYRQCRNRNITITLETLRQINRERLMLLQQSSRNMEQISRWAFNIMMESSQLISHDFLYMVYTCSPHHFTVERRTNTVTPATVQTFNHWWFVRHPYLTDDLGRNSFQLQYRMSRNNFETLLNIVSRHPEYEAAVEGRATPVEIQVATVLWRLANTHFGFRIAETFLGVSAGSYARFTERFITVMSDYINQFVTWGVHDVQTARRKAADFQKIRAHGVRLPNVIGAIDGKLIAIHKPSVHGNSWIDRHNNSSMNLLAVCDANKRFMFIKTGQTGK